MKIVDILLKIEKTSSKNEKVQILKDNDSYKLRDLLLLTYSPDANFNVMSGKTHGRLGLEMDIPVDKIRRIQNIQGRNDKLAELETIMCNHSKVAQKFIARVVDKDLNIGISVKLINKAFPNLIPVFDVMLAEREDRHKYILHYPDDLEFVFVNLKIDGIRCICNCLHGKDSIKFYTRKGKPIPDFLTENIKREIRADFPFFSGKVVDGEIYSNNFQSLMRVFQRKNIDTNSILLRNSCKYAIFDYIDLELQLIDRVKWLEKIKETAFIKKLKYVKLKNDFSLIKNLAKKYIALGHEGIIVKHPHGFYVPKRTFSWMKFKNKESEDLEIIGFEEGERGTKYEGMLGAFVLNYRGKELSCGSGLTDKQRKEFWDMREGLLGKTAQISFMERTKTASLRHPVFECLRVDK